MRLFKFRRNIFALLLVFLVPALNLTQKSQTNLKPIFERSPTSFKGELLTCKTAVTEQEIAESIEKKWSDSFYKVFKVNELREEFNKALSSGNHYSDHSYDSGEIVIRASEVINGKYLAWISRTKAIDYFNLKVNTSFFKEVKSEYSVENRSKPDLRQIWNEVKKILDFVLNEYRQRRIHWSPKFLAKLILIAKEYLFESIYITVSVRNSAGDGKSILGSIRVIAEKNGLVPMEKILGIVVDVGDRIKKEPGNFAILKEVSDTVWPEIMNLLASGFVRSPPGEKENHYITYADSYSKRLYAMLGFKPIPIERIKFNEGVKVIKKTTIENGVPVESYTILSEGVEWTPMEASQETIDSLVYKHNARVSKNKSENTDAEVEAILKRKQNIEALKFRKFFVSKPVFHNGKTIRAEIFFAPKNTRGEVRVRISVLRSGYWQNNFQDIPIGENSEFPMLYDSSVVNDEYTLKYRRRGPTTDLISYNNGVLSIKRNQDVDSFKMEYVEHEGFKYYTRMRTQEGKIYRDPPYGLKTLFQKDLPLFNNVEVDIAVTPDMSLVSFIKLRETLTDKVVTFEF